MGLEQDIAFSIWIEGIPENTFAVTAFVAEEALFGLSKVSVMLVSDNRIIDPDALIDVRATLTIHHKYLLQQRHFSGIVAMAECGCEGHRKTACRLTILSSIYRLDNRSDCRIFQNISVPDIVRTLFREHGIEDVEWIMGSAHGKREFCVQYRETCLAFVERILAEEGIFYYFQHDRQGKEKLIISDCPYQMPVCPGGTALEYNALASGAVKDVYCSSLYRRRKSAVTGFMQKDYSFKIPKASLYHSHNKTSQTGEKQNYEIFDYPGRFKNDTDGELFTRYKFEAARVSAAITHGIANAPFLVSGHAFTLQGHSDKALNIKWRLLTVRHEGVQPQAWGEEAGLKEIRRPGLAAPDIAGSQLAGMAYGSGRDRVGSLLDTMTLASFAAPSLQEGEETAGACCYSCAFTAQDYTIPYRPPQSAKPLIDGPQMAHVVGPPGEEIHTDEHGRVKVHFPWDRHNQEDAENSSCWIRVATAWAGSAWGAVSLPRIGHEVIVDFLEGDPDQPIIIGRTYHATNKNPYRLPDYKTRMVIRSDTHKGQGFNELSFEDQAGQEKVYLHAEKDQELHVQNNRAKRVDNNQSESVGNNKSVEIGNNHYEVIGGNMTLMVGPNRLQNSVTGKFDTFSTRLGALASSLGTADPQNMGEGNMIVGVGKNKSETVMVSSAEIIGAAKVLTTGGGYQVTVGGVKNESVAFGSWEEVGQTKVSVIGHKYELIVGKAKITLERDGTINLDGVAIHINGVNIKIRGETVNLN